MRISVITRHALSLLLLLTLHTAGVFAAEPANVRSRISFTLQSKEDEGKRQSALNISFPKGITPTLFNLSSPSRMVVDLPNLTTHRNRRFDLPLNALFSGIRSGVHPDRIRLVLDLKTGELPQYKVQQADGTLKITFEDIRSEAQKDLEPQEFAATMRVSTQEMDKPAAISLAKSTTDLLPVLKHALEVPLTQRIETTVSIPNTAPVAITLVRRLPALEQVKENETPPSEVKAMLSVTEKDDPSSVSSVITGPTLLAISFTKDEENKESLIQLALSEPSSYSLTKKDNRSYLLELPGLSLSGDHLGLPYFPTREYAGLDSVYPHNTAKGVEAEINVEAGVRLSAFARDKKILVRVLK